MTIAARSIPLVDLRAQFHTIRDEVMTAIQAVLEGMELTLGPNTRAFEEEFAAYCGVRHCIALSNGTDALHVVLRACGIGADDEVITVPNTFVATVEAIELAGARAVLVDVDPRTGNMDPARLEAAIGARTRAVLPVHLYGHPADMAPILQIAVRHHVRVIEDACQAHGAVADGRRAGSFGDAGCFSFYCSKNLGAYGEGGAVVTNDEDLAERVRLLRNHGSAQKYLHEHFGFNARPDEIQGAILRVKLRYLAEWNERRRALAARYNEALAHLPVETPVEAYGATPVYHIYAVRTPRRDELLAWLQRRGVGAAIHYPSPIHLQPGYGHVRAAGRLDAAERWARETLSLPLYPEMTEDDVAYVVDAVSAFFDQPTPDP